MAYSIDAGAEFIKVIYSGTLTNKDIQGVLREALVTDDKGLNLTNRIEDMRKLNAIRLGFDELWVLTKNLQTLQLPRIVKTAILTSNPLQYGIARMFQAILEHPQMKLEIFSNEEEAHHWLSSID